jgi:hypothetical protein
MRWVGLAEMQCIYVGVCTYELTYIQLHVLAPPHGERSNMANLSVWTRKAVSDNCNVDFECGTLHIVAPPY